jgi:hydrogenase expression/formation protein HypC
MCLAIPVRITSIKGKMGMGELGGAQRKVSLMLLDEVEVGDYVLLHAGFAISKINAKEAQELLELLATMEEVASE